MHFVSQKCTSQGRNYFRHSYHSTPAKGDFNDCREFKALVKSSMSNNHYLSRKLRLLLFKVVDAISNKLCYRLSLDVVNRELDRHVSTA